MVKGPGAQTFAVDIFRVHGGEKHDYRVFSELASSDAPKGELRFQGLTMPPEPPLPQIGGSTRREDIFGLRHVRSAEAPRPPWQATWSQEDRSYRLWLLSAVDAVEASNGPGQESGRQMGRRVRYVDAIRAGDELHSVFVGVHEPNGARGTWPIHTARILDVPRNAGPDAVAVKIGSTWGDVLILSGFADRAEVDGVRFAGSFGAIARTSTGERWLFSVGASSLREDAFGFSGETGWWRSEAQRTSRTVISATTKRPANWPPIPRACQNYVLANDGQYDTGFPVGQVSDRTITVRRFPLPKITAFQLPAVQYRCQGVE
jgi:hypothetical protein